MICNFNVTDTLVGVDGIGCVTTKHTFHIFDAIHAEGGVNQIFNTNAIACVLGYQAGVMDLFDLVLLLGPGFAGNIAN